VRCPFRKQVLNNAGEGSDSTGFYSNGASPTVPATDLSTTGINLHSGDIFAVHLVYDGTTLTMSIKDTVSNAVFTTSTAVNIPSVVGGNTAYVGFGGGVGGSVATQEIITWTYGN
jgi:Legume lectin domain